MNNLSALTLEGEQIWFEKYSVISPVTCFNSTALLKHVIGNIIAHMYIIKYVLMWNFLLFYLCMFQKKNCENAK